MKENKNSPCDNKKSQKPLHEIYQERFTQKIIEAKDKLIIDGKEIKGVVKGSVTEEKQNGYSIVTLSIVTDDYELIPHQAFCGCWRRCSMTGFDRVREIIKSEAFNYILQATTYEEAIKLMNFDESQNYTQAEWYFDQIAQEIKRQALKQKR